MCYHALRCCRVAWRFATSSGLSLHILLGWVGPPAAGNDKRRLRPVANLDGCPRRGLGESALPRSGFVFAAPQVCAHSSGGGVLLPGDLSSRASGKPICVFFGYLFLRGPVFSLRARCSFTCPFLPFPRLPRSLPFRRSGKLTSSPWILLAVGRTLSSPFPLTVASGCVVARRSHILLLGSSFVCAFFWASLPSVTSPRALCHRYGTGFALPSVLHGFPAPAKSYEITSTFSSRATRATCLVYGGVFPTHYGCLYARAHS